MIRHQSLTWAICACMQCKHKMHLHVDLLRHAPELCQCGGAYRIESYYGALLRRTA